VNPSRCRARSVRCARGIEHHVHQHAAAHAAPVLVIRRKARGEQHLQGRFLEHHVWVDHDGGRAYGRIAALPPVDQGESARFVVLLDNRRTVVACLEDRKGSQWGCAAEDEGT
jgi:hypothetical protein